MTKDKVISFLELMLNNCVFNFHGYFYQHIQRALIGSPVSVVIANIYMEYFGEISLGSQCPIPIPGWKDM